MPRRAHRRRHQRLRRRQRRAGRPRRAIVRVHEGGHGAARDDRRVVPRNAARLSLDHSLAAATTARAAGLTAPFCTCFPIPAAAARRTLTSSLRWEGYRFEWAYLAIQPGHVTRGAAAWRRARPTPGAQLRPAARPRRGRGRSLPAPPRAEPLDRHAPRSHRPSADRASPAGSGASLRAILRAADRTICVSRADHEELARVAGTAAARRAMVIPNGVRISPPRNSARPRLRPRGTGNRSGRHGRDLDRITQRQCNDPLVAVRAADRARVTLLVVGDGPLRSTVQHAAGANANVPAGATTCPACSTPRTSTSRPRTARPEPVPRGDGHRSHSGDRPSGEHGGGRGRLTYIRARGRGVLTAIRCVVGLRYPDVRP